MLKFLWMLVTVKQQIKHIILYEGGKQPKIAYCYPSLPHIFKYRIGGNFRGRKLSRISRIGAFRGENFRRMLTGRIMGVACLEFRGENFRRWLKNREIRESFLPRKFPAIRYYTETLIIRLACVYAQLNSDYSWNP